MAHVPYRRVTAVLLASVMVLAAAAADPYLGDWPTQGADMGRTGKVAGSVATRRAEITWATDLLAPGSSPAVVGGRIYCSERIFYGAGDTAIACRDARSGALLWRRVLSTSDAITPPTVINGRVIFTRLSSNTSQVMSLRASDGAPDWSAPIGAQFERYGAPCVSEGRVVSGGGTYGGLYGFGESAGNPLFFNSTLPFVSGWTPSAVPGGVLTWMQGTLRRHNSLGAVERSVVIDTSSDYNYGQINWVAVNAERAVMSSSLGLYSVQPATFARQWSVAGSNFTGSPVLAGDSVFVRAGAVIQRRASSTGVLLASSPDLGVVAYGEAAWLIASDDAVVASNSQATWILDRTTLAVRQRLPIGGQVVLADGAMFVMDASQPRLLRFDLRDVALDPAVEFAVTKNGVPVAEGANVAGDIDVRVTIRNAIGQHAQIYGNFVVLHSMDHGAMIDTSPWTMSLRVDTTRFFDGENLLSVHVHPHNHHEGRHTTDFTFNTFRVISANGVVAPNGDQLLPQFQPSNYAPGAGEILPANSTYGFAWPTIRASAVLQDDGSIFGPDQFPTNAGPIQIISHLGTSVLGRARWHTQLPPFGDLQLIDGVDARPFLSAQPKLARIVYFFSDRAGRANYYTSTILLPAITPEDEQAVPVPVMHAHVLNLHDGDHLVADDAAGFTVWVKVINPRPAGDHYRTLNLWIGNRSMVVVRMQPFLDAMPSGATSCVIPVVIPASEIADLLNARSPGEGSRAYALWIDFTKGDLRDSVESQNMPNGEHLHLNSVRLASTPWPWGSPTVSITSPYENELVAGSPSHLRYRMWGNLSGVTRALVSVDGGAPVSDTGFDGVMPFPILARGAHTVSVTLANSAGVPLTNPEATAEATFTVLNRAPTGLGDGWRTPKGTTLTVPVASGVLANDVDPDGDPLAATLVSTALHGTLTLAANGSFTYQPQGGYSGVDTFSYRVTDGTVSSAPLIVTLLVGCDGRSGVPGSWSTLGNGPGHPARVVGSLSGRQPVQAWSFSSSIPGWHKHAAIAGGRVHVGLSPYSQQDPMSMVALNLATGNQLWRRDVPAGFSLTPPTVDGGRVYYQRGNHGGDTQLWSVDETTGAVIWQAPFSAQWENYLAPCVADGKVFINGGAYGGMYGFRQSDGAELFFAYLEQESGWTPTWADGRLFTHVNNNLRQHDPATGVRLIDVEMDTSPFGSSDPTPAVASDGRLVVRTDVGLAVHDAVTLGRIWRVYEEGRYVAMPAVADGLVYIPLAAGGVEVRSLADGVLQRTFSAPEAALGQPILSDDLLILASDSATRALDRATGQTRWTLPVGGLLSLGQNSLCITSRIPPERVVCYRLPSSNVAPVAVADAAITPEDAALTLTTASLLANDSDADGNPLTVRVTSQPAHGTLTVISGGHRYVPAVDWFGTDSFTYVANDGQADSQPATVTITVTPVEDPPAAFKPGLLAQFYDYTTALSVIPDLTGRTPEVTRTDAQIAYASVSTAWNGLPTTMIDTFASRHTGWLKIDTAGSYTLFISSDDGSRVFLDGALLINNDGLHGMQERSATVTLTAGYHHLKVEFFESGGGAGLEFRWSGPSIAKQIVPASALWQEDPAPPYVAGLLAEFFDSTTALSAIPDLSGRVPEVSRTDAQIAYASVSTAWSGLPASMVDTFASRHSGWLKIDTAGSYTLFISSDDGSRVSLDGALLINNDGLHGLVERSATLTLAAGYHPLRVEFFDNTGGAGLQFRWSGPGIAKQLVPTSALWRLPAAVAGLPAPWTSTDIGAVGLAGSATGDGDDFTILGGGADIWGNADAFQFVHRPLTTDGELIARVVSLGNTNPWAKAGVMVRATTAANSVHGMMVITPGNGASFQHRAVTGGASAGVTSAGRTAPYWVRVVRSGSSVSGWISADGIAWSQVGTTVTLPLGTTPIIGLPATAHDNAMRTTVVFDQVVFVPAAGG